jgi:hypothetical protein
VKPEEDQNVLLQIFAHDCAVRRFCMHLKLAIASSRFSLSAPAGTQLYSPLKKKQEKGGSVSASRVARCRQ